MNEEVKFPPTADKKLLDVLKRCLEKDPTKRSSVEELQSHPYLKQNKESLDETLMLGDDADLMKAVHELRSCTPRTSVRKLRRLMLKGKENEMDCSSD
ncbi:hypothetical protein AB6A40_009514 [Gnathostoma spinigerum]|uniref:Uncharacterized protein n=1 Tax=Gnathostoma spinigerum TaxID=75299 RepID=A0ABD6ES70_9BILA